MATTNIYAQAALDLLNATGTRNTVADGISDHSIMSMNFSECFIYENNDTKTFKKGEFEGNEYVIMKMDRDNFIIFPEYDDGEGGIQIPFSLSIYKNSLLDAINSYAQEKGVI